MQAISKDDRTWGMLAHLSAIVGYFLIPFGNIIAPLVIWLIKKDQSWFVDNQGKEALNFQISMTLYAFVSGILMLVLVGFVLIVIVYILGLVLTVVATIKANEGVLYRYPLTIRFIH